MRIVFSDQPAEELNDIELAVGYALLLLEIAQYSPDMAAADANGFGYIIRDFKSFDRQATLINVRDAEGLLQHILDNPKLMSPYYDEEWTTNFRQLSNFISQNGTEEDKKRSRNINTVINLRFRVPKDLEIPVRRVVVGAAGYGAYWRHRRKSTKEA